MIDFQNKALHRTFVASSLLAVMLWLFPSNSLSGATLHSDALVFARAPHQASILYRGHHRDTEYEPAKQTINITVTSYNSEPGQTDSTPFVTAFNTQVRDGIIATNYLPKGTKVRFPDLYGNKVFVVEDRMNVRYTKRADIWSADKEFSKQFGARYLRMEIL